MKKTIAVGGASLLGFSTLGLGAVSASAADDPVVQPCLTDADHVVTIGGVSSNWYMDCIPQYALGEVAFTIVSDVDFPASFLDLDDPAVTSVSSNTGSDADAYFGIAPEAAGFGYLNVINSGSGYQTYVGDMMFRVASVGSISEASLPAPCLGLNYTGAYVVNYEPTTVTFTQLVDGVEWRYDLVVTPQPLTFGLSILNTGAFDPTGSQCVTSNGIVTFAVDSVSDPLSWAEVGEHATARSDRQTLMPYFGGAKTLPDVSRYVPPAPEAPVLPAAGLDIAAPLGLAATFLALGVAGGYLRRRRANA